MVYRGNWNYVYFLRLRPAFGAWFSSSCSFRIYSNMTAAQDTRFAALGAIPETTAAAIATVERGRGRGRKLGTGNEGMGARSALLPCTKETVFTNAHVTFDELAVGVAFSSCPAADIFFHCFSAMVEVHCAALQAVLTLLATASQSPSSHSSIAVRNAAFLFAVNTKTHFFLGFFGVFVDTVCLVISLAVKCSRMFANTCVR